MYTENKEMLELRGKIIDIESNVLRIGSLNNLLSSFANGNCPEASIISDLIFDEINEIKRVLNNL